MSGWWVHQLWQQGRATELVAWIFWVIASITLHELAHGWVATAEGDDTPKKLGRLTVNPVVHMGVPSIVLFLLIGIAWGLMPINPSKFRHGRLGRILVSLAGPAMNVVLALIALAGIRLGATGELRAFLFVGGYLNIVLFAFNLIPIPPLDGSTVLRALSPAIARLYTRPQAGLFGMALLLVVFLSGLGNSLFDAAQNLAAAIAGL